MTQGEAFTILDRALKGGPLEEVWLSYIDGVRESRTPDQKRLQLLERVISDVKRMT